LRHDADRDGREPVVELGAGLATNGDGVFEALCGYERDAGAFALQHGVGADGGAVADFEWFAVCDLPESFEDGLRRIGRGGKELEDAELPVCEVDAVGEGASGVDGDAHGFAFFAGNAGSPP